MKFYHLLFGCSVFSFYGCSTSPEVSVLPASKEVKASSTPKEFVQYWYSGKAEINSYNLQQSRYGELRNGDAVMVFVTEDFSKSKQVKLDYPKGSIRDAVSVLKLNFLKKFHTGIYDYSLMQSVFTPVDVASFPNTLKATFSSQDWCGQVYSQMNLEKNRTYRLTDFSYFEKEGDTDRKLKNAMLEEEIWNRLRIDPDGIPTGEVKLIPTQEYARLNHRPLKPAGARISLDKKTESASELKVEYLHFERSLKIQFQSDFPFKILGWEERNGDQPPTTATLQQTIRSAYWKENGNRFENMRDSLKMKF